MSAFDDSMVEPSVLWPLQKHRMEGRGQQLTKPFSRQSLHQQLAVQQTNQTDQKQALDHQLLGILVLRHHTV